MKTVKLSKIFFAAKAPIALALLLSLSACAVNPSVVSSTKKMQAEIEAYALQSGAPSPLLASPAGLVGSPNPAQMAAMATSQSAVGRWASQPYIGSRALAVTGDERLPPVFYASFDLSFDDLATNGLVPIDSLAQRLTAITKVPVRIKRDVWDGGTSFSSVASLSASASAPAPSLASMFPPVATVGVGLPQAAGAPMPMPLPGAISGAQAAPRPLAAPPAPPSAVGGYNPRSTMVDIRPLTKQGTKPRLLDVLNFATDQLGVSFSYTDGAVVLERYVSEALELDFGEGKVKSALEFGAKGGGASGSSSASSGVKVDQDYTSDMYNSAVGAIREYVSKTPGSTVVATDFGRVMVTTTKETMGRTRELVRQINARLQMRVMVQFDVYHFTNKSGDEKGFDWNLVYASLSKVLGVQMGTPGSVLSGAAASLGFNIIPNGTSETSRSLGNSSLMIKSLNSVGYNSFVKSYPMMLSNRTWGRIMKTDTDVYISEIVPGATSSATGSAIPGIKQTSITFGDDVAIKANVLDSNRICLTLAAGFGDLLSLEKASVGNSGFFTQQPKTSQSSLQREVCHDPGETVIVSGLSRKVANNSSNILAEGLGIGFGGSRAVSTSTENMMIVMRASLL